MTDRTNEYPTGLPEKSVAAPHPAPRLTKRDWLLLAACLALAALFCHCFDLQRPYIFRSWREGPGAGFSLFLLGGLAAALAVLGRRPYSRGQYLMIGAYAALALSFTLVGDPLLRRLNYLVCLLLAPLTLFSLAGLSNGSPWEAQALRQTLRRFFPALFRYFPRPFGDLLRGGANPGRKGRSLLLGLLLALPLLGLAFALLSSADAVFRGIFVDFAGFLRSLSLGRVGWVALRTLVVGLCGFSLLYTLVRQPRPLGAVPSRQRLPLLSWNVILILLNAVYLLFVVIQFAVLFGGKETAAIKGGFAEYARSGFFQLAALAAINLVLLLLARSAWPDKLSIRLNGSLLLASTCVILASALWRMTLYIRAFGLSVLRATTLWGMAIIALALVLAGIKLWRPGLKIYPLLLGVTVAAWLAFNYCGVDRLVADYNVEHYLAGELEQVDVDYLGQDLSPAARPALTRLAEQGDPAARRYLLQLDRYRKRLPWADWSLPWLIYK